MPPKKKPEPRMTYLEQALLYKRNKELEQRVQMLEKEKRDWKDWMMQDKPEPPAQPGVTQGENFGTGIIESSMKQVQRRVCHQNGHQIALALDELVSKRATYADAPAKEIARERTWMCLRCGMSLAEIRGEK